MDNKKITLILILLIGFAMNSFVFVNLSDLKGNIVNLRNVCSDKVVLINFFSTTCEPCMEELPEIYKLVKRIHNNKFLLILVSVDPSSVTNTEIEEFLKKYYPDSKVSIYRDIYHQFYGMNRERGAPVSIPRNVILNNNKAELDSIGFHSDTIQKLELKINEIIKTAPIKQVNRFLLDFSMPSEEDKYLRTRAFAKAYCSSKGILLIDPDKTEDVPERTIVIELKRIGQYDMIKVVIKDRENEFFSKSSMIYQESEMIKKVSELLTETVNFLNK